MEGLRMTAVRKFTSKMAPNGQVVVPKELRDLLSLTGGETFDFLAEEGDLGMLKITLRRPAPSFKKLVGVMPELKGRPVHKILREIDDEEWKF